MLAVTANWLLTDGTLAPARSADAGGWLQAVRRAVIRAGFRRDGCYAPVESATLVFAGDTFDWLLSDVWAGRDRPWHGGPRNRAARATVAAASLRAARPLLARLGRWTRLGIPVPAVDRYGRPSVRGVHHAPLHVVMLTGDRDAWAGEAVLSQRDPAHRFGVWVGESWADDTVTVRHGHDRDPATHAVTGSPGCSTGRPPALAESVAVDLVVPFALKLKVDHALWHLVRPHIRTIAAASLGGLPQAVARLVGLWGAGSRSGRRVVMAWRRSVAEWQKAASHEPPATAIEHDVVMPLAAWFDASVEDTAFAMPEAIAVLSMARSDAEEPRTILGHPSMHGAETGPGPWLMIIKPTCSLEPLGQRMPGSPIVTIGSTDCRRLVEAA